MKKHVILHPFLFAIFPVLFLYAHNIGQLTLPDLAAPMAIVAVSSFLLWLALRSILRDQVRAAVVGSLFWMWFFSCGYVHGLGRPMTFVPEEPSRTHLFLALYLGLLCCLAALAIIQRRGLLTLSSMLNVAAVVLVGWRVVAIGAYELDRALTYRSLHHSVGIGAVHARSPGVLPNIYYIVLDGYGRADILSELYRYDNSDFLAYLRRRGFSVARDGRANYCQTLLSLASSLNLCYLDQVARQLGASSDHDPLVTLVKHNRLFTLLRGRGYRIVALPSGFMGTEMRTADVFIEGQSSLNEFQSAVVETTPIPLLMPERPRRPFLHRHTAGRRILYAFDHLPDATKLKPPVFVFAHIMCPHPPFLFDHAGRLTSHPRPFDIEDGSHFRGTRGEYVAQYTEQLIFVNAKIKATVDAILRKSDWPSVIILQSDHGPGSRLDWDSAARTYQRERLGALIACRFPDGGSEPIDDDLSPVNLFRVVLNRYLGTKLALLPNDSYYSTWDHPYRFVRVTDKVEVARTTR